MKNWIGALAATVLLIMPAVNPAHAEMRQSPPGRGQGGVEYVKTRPRPFRATREAVPVMALSDTELAQSIGLNQTTGRVDNATSDAFKLQLDSSVLFISRTDSLQLGVSPLIWGSPDRRLRFNLDLANDMVGASLSLVVIPVVRLSFGLGYGYLFGGQGRYLDSINEPRQSLYLKGSFRLW
jgi:hypothetical protein